MRLRDIMSSGVLSIGSNEPADAAWDMMRRERIRHLAVVDGTRLVGIVSERDLGGPEGSEVRENRTVAALMVRDAVSAPPNLTLRQAANLMRGRTIGSLLVVERDNVVGIVTATDVLDQLGRGATRARVAIERPPVRRPPASAVRTGHAARLATGTGAPTGRRGGGRARQRVPAPRSALPPALPKIGKRERGRSAQLLPPASIRVIGAQLGDEDRSYLRRKLGQKLGKAASSIERVSVRVTDENGPRGGVDQVCRVKVVLTGLPSVVVDHRAPTLLGAIDGALRATERAVMSAVRRRRLKPLRDNARRPRQAAAARP
jgi:CBS domain-containing protein